jgi:hypothetical protein
MNHDDSDSDNSSFTVTVTVLAGRRQIPVSLSPGYRDGNIHGAAAAVITVPVPTGEVTAARLSSEESRGVGDAAIMPRPAGPVAAVPMCHATAVVLAVAALPP